MECKGCDNRTSSGRVLNECGKCEKSCMKCDGRTDSDADYNDCKICVLGTTGRDRNHGKDCDGKCGGPNIMHPKCNKCVHKDKKVCRTIV